MKALALVLLVGCTSDVDIGGMYMVTSDVSSSPCGTDAPVQSPPAYLQFKKSTFLGATFWSMQGCTDAAGTMCDTTGGTSAPLTVPTDDGWKGTISEDSFSGTSCYLGYGESTATLKSKMLVLDSNTYADMPALDQAHCTTAEAQKRGTTMPCLMHEHIEATKL